MIDIDKIKKEIDEVLNENPHSKKNSKLYDYISKEITIPTINELIEKNYFIAKGKSWFENCYDCSLNHVPETRIDSKKTFWGTGNPDATIMFILMNPGEGETDVHPKLKGITETGVNLSGRGSILRWIAKLAGYKDFENSIYTTNVCKCCTKGDTQPDDDDRDKCMKYLKNEIAQVKPDKIAIFGVFSIGGTEKLFPELKEKNKKDGKYEKHLITINGKTTEIKCFDHHSYVLKYSHTQQFKNKYPGGRSDWVMSITKFLIN